MFSDFEPYQAFEQASSNPSPSSQLRRSRTYKECIAFWCLNAITFPFVAVCYLTIGAEGLRKMLGIFAMRLYKLPIPGAEYLRNYSGWDKLDLAMPMAIALFIAVTILWVRVFTNLQDAETMLNRKDQNPILFYLQATIVGIIILGDAGIFYVGLESQTSNKWNSSSEFIPLIATVTYAAGLALLGLWHADFHNSSKLH